MIGQKGERVFKLDIRPANFGITKVGHALVSCMTECILGQSCREAESGSVRTKMALSDVSGK